MKLMNEQLDKARGLFSSAEGKALLAKMEQSSKAYDKATKDLLAMAKAERESGKVVTQNRESVRMALVNNRQIADEVDGLLTKLTMNKEENAKRASIASTQLYENSSTLIVIMIGLALLLGIIIGLVVSNRISRNVAALANGLDTIAREQNFAFRAPLVDADETGMMANSINNLLQELQKGIEESNKTVLALANGDFKQRIVSDYNGDLLVLKNGINESAESISDVMKELSNAMIAIRDGNFGIRLNADVEGEYKVMLDMASGSMEQMNRVIADINNVMQQVASGVFSQRVEASANGDMLLLKNAINQTSDVLDAVISDITNVMEAQGKGDLTQTVTTQCEGQLLQIKESINNTAGNLATTIAHATSASNIVKTAADEVAQGSQDLSQRVQEQAAALEETSATMDQMNSAVQNNSENSLEAAKVANEVQQKASQGEAVMQQTIEAMKAIQESSHRIADIVNLIDGIAFQTNLLALNAAVEAARAGDHGRGFAVVAGEVRNLAGKSAEAAKDITVLIEESVSRINQGTQLASKSGEVLQEMTSSIGLVTQMVSQIAKASEEQAEGITQVHSAISQIDQVTQQNAALVEQTSAAAESMSEQAEGLGEAMDFFTTGQNLKAHQPRVEKKPSNVIRLEDSQEKKQHSKELNLTQATRKDSVHHDQEWDDF